MSERSYAVDNPATGDTYCTRTLASADEARVVLRSAAAAQRHWARVTVEERAALVDRFADAIQARLEEIARDITGQMGKPIQEARGEVRTLIDRARKSAALAASALAPQELPPKEGFLRRILREPVGVVLDIPAWNYPLLTAVNVIVPALLAGNAVIVKHSRRTPLCGMHFERGFREAGAPEDLVRALDADHAVTAALIAEPSIGYVGFTGSVAGGREIYKTVAAQCFIDCGLELGGKDPAYVRADADLDFAVPNLAEGAFYNTGQSCCAIERIYVHESRYRDFVDAFVANTKATYAPGDPMADGTTLGAMAQASAADALTHQVEEAVAKGGKLLLGGAPATVGGKGRFFEATVVSDVTDRMEIMAEESFGPVIGITSVRDDDEAVRRMNDNAYGLTASIWSRDVDRSLELASRVDAGTLFLNRCDYLDPELPWTGYKDSGKGSTLSAIGIVAFTRPKSIHFRLPASKSA